MSLCRFQFAQHPAHVFARDAGHRCKVLWSILWRITSAPRAVVFAEMLRELEQGARQPRFDCQKDGGGHGVVGFPQSCSQHVHQVAVDFRIMLLILLEMLSG